MSEKSKKENKINIRYERIGTSYQGSLGGCTWIISLLIGMILLGSPLTIILMECVDFLKSFQPHQILLGSFTGLALILVFSLSILGGLIIATGAVEAIYSITGNKHLIRPKYGIIIEDESMGSFIIEDKTDD